MEPTYIIRRVDKLGRVIIPAEICRKMDIKDGDEFEIFIDTKSGMISFKKIRNLGE